MTVPAYVDIDRLCTELCICERTADAWVRQGIIPAPRQRGGKRLWKWREVEESLDEGVIASADTEAERVRNATQQLAAQAAKDHRGNIRRRDPRVSRKSDLQGAGPGNAKELSRASGDG